jgi:ribosome-associated protein
MVDSSYPRTSSQSASEATGFASHVSRSDDPSYNLALTIAQAADDRKGADILLLNVADVSYLADYFVVVTGFSNVQVRAIANSIVEKVQEEWQREPLRKEGQSEGNWVLLDYGDVIVHLFMPKERAFYNLEAFWGHAEQIPFTSLSPNSIHPVRDSLK